MVITGIATQGFGNASLNEWVTSYMVFYDKRGAEETVYCTMEDGETLKVSSLSFWWLVPNTILNAKWTIIFLTYAQHER